MKPVTLLLAGDVMTGRGSDQAMARPSDPTLHEPSVRDARHYVALALGSTTSGIPPEWRAVEDSPGLEVVTDLSVATARETASRRAGLRQPGDICIISIHWGSNWGFHQETSYRDCGNATGAGRGDPLDRDRALHQAAARGLRKTDDIPILRPCARKER